MMVRTVAAEALDHLAADDPAALRSRRDLRRVHRAMGTHRILLRAIRATQMYRQRAGPLRVLELGAGDGTLMLGVAQALAGAWPSVELRLLDRQDLVQPPTLAGFAACGWAAKPLVVDVLDWASAPGGLLAPAADSVPTAAQRPWDLIVANLFLHHFEAAPLAHLLAAAAARSRCFLACEPRRAGVALVGSHLIGLIGANAVTRDDAVLSVHAGFRGQEVSALWPAAAALAGGPGGLDGPGGLGGPSARGGSDRLGGPGAAGGSGVSAGWTLAEYPAGLFSHCFRAERQAGAGCAP